MKLVIEALSCVNALAYDVPTHIFAELDSIEIEKIKSLAELVKEKKVDSIHYSSSIDEIIECCSESTISTLTETGTQLRDFSISDIKSLNDDLRFVEEQSIVVFHDSFQFMVIPKHLEKDHACYTNRISIGVLDTLDTYCEV